MWLVASVSSESFLPTEYLNQEVMMPVRPGWHDEYWKQLDKETARKIRTMCPRCGSSNTYYNQQYQTWRCGRCEHSFMVEGFSGDKKPWWKRLLGRES